jgi:hypothetical protein
MFMRVGLTPGTRLAPIGAPGASHLTRQLFAAFRAGREGAPRLSVLTPLDETIDALNTYEPEAILGYPSVAGLLAVRAARGPPAHRTAAGRGPRCSSPPCSTVRCP